MKVSNFNLAIGIPNNYKTVPSAFFDSILLMDIPPFTYIRSSASHNLDGIREGIVEEALKTDCTHLWMTDTDQTYEKGTLARLLSHGKDIIGGLICRRYPPFDPLVFSGDIGHYSRIEGWTEGDLIQVDATGTGSLIFNLDVFRNIPKPWFQLGDGINGPIGEDFYFCSKARKYGYEIYVDTGCQIGHLSEMLVTLDSYKLYKCLDEARNRNNLAFNVEHGVVKTE